MNKLIDHTILKPEATLEAIERECLFAIKKQVASVCVPSHSVAFCHNIMTGSDVKLCTVLGFPYGNTPVKYAEAQRLIEDGADELDMVVNISLVKSGRWNAVWADISSIRDVCHGRILKVIFENCYLTDYEKMRLCEICNQADVDFVKTSTGTAPAGARTEDVALMRRHFPRGIKASGGIRTLDRALHFRDIGATRIGTSHTAAILEELLQRETSTTDDGRTP